jgi:hypothetical protein
MASDSYVRLSLDDLLGFIRGNELALIYSDLSSGPPNAFVIKELQKSHPTLCVGAVTAFVLHQVPADLQQHLAAELRRRGLNGLWLPTGYYLFLHGKLVGHHYPPPVNIRSYAPLFVLAGFALMERLLTDRWGKTVNLIEPTLDITIGVPIVAELRRQILQALLDDAKYRVHDQENEHTHEQAQADDSVVVVVVVVVVLVLIFIFRKEALLIEQVQAGQGQARGPHRPAPRPSQGQGAERRARRRHLRALRSDLVERSLRSPRRPPHRHRRRDQERLPPPHPRPSPRSGAKRRRPPRSREEATTDQPRLRDREERSLT